MYRKAFALIVLFIIAFASLDARQLPNSALIAPVKKMVKQAYLALDTVVAVNTIDTLTPNILKVRDSLTNEVWVSSIRNGYGFEVFSLQDVLYTNYKKEIVVYQPGDILPKGEIWILAVVGFLLILFAVLKNSFGKQFSAVVQSFYSNRALSNLNKEDNLVTSWSFLLLFIQFGFTIGMFFYLFSQYKDTSSVKSGFGFFVTISVAVILLYLLKIVVLRFLGFVFNIQKPLHHYISILYLSYFNASLLFFPVVIAFALSPLQYSYIYAYFGVAALVVIFILQFVRASVNILSQYRFPKLYLFLYLCTLEICPIFILIKTIGL